MQTGVIRTNCMDNLDRTNVTQSAFARWTLERQLQVLGVLDQGDEIQYYEELDTIFRISKQRLKCPVEQVVDAYV
jgi:phosphatidylinositol 4-phosphatase